MRNFFGKASATPALPDAEQVLRSSGADYQKQPDGTFYVRGNLKLSNEGLERLPDLSAVVVEGAFFCNNNRLTSLKGAPQKVGGSFICDHNQLVSLEYAPPSVGGNFWCNDNQLSGLEGAPQSIHGSLWCHHNPLKSLAFAPRNFSNLESDLGDFSAWNRIPPEKRAEPPVKPKAVKYPKGFNL